MVEEYLGAVKLFAGDFVIYGYSYCNGALMSITQNAALFSLLGTTYGGNGVSTFQLPDLRSRVPISQGNGQGLTPRVIGETGGLENVTVLAGNMPPHNHVFNATSAPTNSSPTAGPSTLLGSLQSADGLFYAPAGVSGTNEALNPLSLSMAGSNLPHNNIMPGLAINYLIALTGLFPSRS